MVPTERTWEMLKNYSIVAVNTNSIAMENLQFLSYIVVTANHSFVRFTIETAKAIIDITAALTTGT